MKRTHISKPTFSEIVARTWPETRVVLESKAVLASRLAHASSDPSHRAFYYKVKHAALAAICKAAHFADLTSGNSNIRVDVDDRLVFRGARVFRIRLRSRVKLHVPEMFASPLIHRLAQSTRKAMVRR